MCLAALAIAQSDRFPFVLASNRDEFFHREAAPLGWWTAGGVELLGGRDLSAGGTWLALSRAGVLALVTNVREPGRVLPGAPSRGELVPHWLAGGGQSLLDDMAAVPRNGFNFLTVELHGLQGTWFSNRPQPQRRTLGAGLHGVSNAALDTPWPKLLALKRQLVAALAAPADLATLQASLFEALSRREPAPDAELPATGVPLDRERQLSPPFIRIEGEAGVYGTRCSTLVIVEATAQGRRVHMVERRFADSGTVSGETARAFDLDAVF